jgi:hypothetical protein
MYRDELIWSRSHVREEHDEPVTVIGVVDQY